LQTETGVQVTQIEPESPAARAGLVAGDTIVALGETAVGGIDDLHRLRTEEKVGVSSALTVLRGVEKLMLWIVPGESRRAA
jgi:S1-C subfamily serine protease